MKAKHGSQSEKELAAVFDLLKISLGKTDPTLDKSNALKDLLLLLLGGRKQQES